MDLSLYIALGAALLAGLVVALRRIAPLTATKKDDAALAALEPVSKIADDLVKK